MPPDYPFGRLILTAALISLAVIGTRIAWVFPATYLPRLLIPAVRRSDPFPSWRPVALIAWSGMRGGISLAVALTIPRTMETGANGTGTPFPFRDELLFITFVVILATLVLQGLSLPVLIRGLGIASGNEEREEEIGARNHALNAAVAHLDAQSDTETAAEVFAELRRHYEKRRNRLTVSSRENEEPENGDDLQTKRENVAAALRLKQALLDAQRTALVELRDQDKISDETLRRIQRDLDLEESLLHS